MTAQSCSPTPSAGYQTQDLKALLPLSYSPIPRIRILFFLIYFKYDVVFIIFSIVDMYYLLTFCNYSKFNNHKQLVPNKGYFH